MFFMCYCRIHAPLNWHTYFTRARMQTERNVLHGERDDEEEEERKKLFIFALRT